ncbi:hypothetical protein P7K49_027803 [Saguinus oedipus]|uniref:Uncharacterized protein n=1 Tax=Saguinus oedipus TaxID=9490 RepID=A0ABQ9UBF6_SAGOE|nr:hypothetical protein P7K49_027803 [Saguinus oedipus]
MLPQSRVTEDPAFYSKPIINREQLFLICCTFETCTESLGNVAGIYPVPQGKGQSMAGVHPAWGLRLLMFRTKARSSWSQCGPHTPKGPWPFDSCSQDATRSPSSSARLGTWWPCDAAPSTCGRTKGVLPSGSLSPTSGLHTTLSPPHMAPELTPTCTRHRHYTRPLSRPPRAAHGTVTTHTAPEPTHAAHGTVTPHTRPPRRPRAAHGTVTTHTVPEPTHAAHGTVTPHTRPPSRPTLHTAPSPHTRSLS